MSAFKTCSGCGREFSLDDILNSGEIEPAGMQFIDEDFKWNVYYFNHMCDNCGSTFLIPVRDFLSVIPETIPETVLTGEDRCEQHCLRMSDLQECQQECYYAPFRRFLLSLIVNKKLVKGPPVPAPGRMMPIPMPFARK